MKHGEVEGDRPHREIRNRFGSAVTAHEGVLTGGHDLGGWHHGPGSDRFLDAREPNLVGSVEPKFSCFERRRFDDLGKSLIEPRRKATPAWKTEPAVSVGVPGLVGETLVKTPSCLLHGVGVGSSGGLDTSHRFRLLTHASESGPPHDFAAFVFRHA